MARTKSTPHPAPTVVLLVRHGQTPTTGKLLPGRAPGLHLADVGNEQAQKAAERIAALKTVDAIYASPLGVCACAPWPNFGRGRTPNSLQAAS